MALHAVVFFDMFDDQHRTNTFEFFVPPPADFGAGVDLPTLAHIVAVANAIVASDMSGFSAARIRNFGVKVYDDDPGGAGINTGTGDVPIKSYIDFASGVGSTGKVDPFGDAIGIHNKIPSGNQGVISFLNKDRNQISVVGANWDALRTALHNIGFTDVNNATYTTEMIAMEASYFLGKAEPMRPR